MKAPQYVSYSRWASSLYLACLTIVGGLFVALVAAVVSPTIEHFFSLYGVLGGLFRLAMWTCFPLLGAALLVGYLGRCPACNKSFSQISLLKDRRKPSNWEAIKRCMRTAFGRECVCPACETDAMRWSAYRE